MKLSPETKRDLVLLGIALCVAGIISLLAWLLLPTARAGGASSQPSTYFNEPYGAKAAYLALGELGFSIERLRRPIDTDTLAGLDALVLLKPIVCLNKDEDRVLRNWVHDGHSLLVAPPDQPSFGDENCAGPYAWFNFAIGAASPSAPPEPRTTCFDADTSGIDPLLAEVHELATKGAACFDPDEPLTWPADDVMARTVWQTDAGAVAVEIDYGEGRIIALADTFALTNEGLRSADDAVWLVNLAAALTGGRPDARIAFDEYHAGFPYHEQSWLAVAHLLLQERWAWCVVQVALVAGLALFARGASFGRREGLRSVARRTQGEFTRAAGRLLHEARGSDLALSTLRGHYRERVCSRLHMAANCANRAISDALTRQGHAELAELLGDAGAPRDAGGKKDASLLRYIQRLHAAVEAFEHGTGPGHEARAERAR